MFKEPEIELENIFESDEYKRLDCGTPTINDYLINGIAYFDHIMKFANTKLVWYDSSIVGYFTMQFRTILMENDGLSYPCVYLKNICTDKEYQDNGIGTKVLNYVVLTSKELSDFVGCRGLLIDALNEENKIEWYQKRGFDFLDENDRIDVSKPTVKMFIDFRDESLVEDMAQV